MSFENNDFDKFIQDIEKIYDKYILDFKLVHIKSNHY